MISGFAEAFAAIRDELKTRITQKVHAAGVMVPEEDIAQIQNVILWMTIDPELQEVLLMAQRSSRGREPFTGPPQPRWRRRGGPGGPSGAPGGAHAFTWH